MYPDKTHPRNPHTGTYRPLKHTGTPDFARPEWALSAYHDRLQALIARGDLTPAAAAASLAVRLPQAADSCPTAVRPALSFS
jgi:hypothetical protein